MDAPVDRHLRHGLVAPLGDGAQRVEERREARQDLSEEEAARSLWQVVEVVLAGEEPERQR